MIDMGARVATETLISHAHLSRAERRELQVMYKHLYIYIYIYIYIYP